MHTNKKHTKRATALLLALVMTLTLIPISVSADAASDTAATALATALGTGATANGSTVTFTGTFAVPSTGLTVPASVTLDVATGGSLTVQNVSSSPPSPPTIGIEVLGVLNVSGGTVTVSSSGASGIQIPSGSMTVLGGTVNVSNSNGIGINVSGGSMTVSGGTVNVSNSNGGTTGIDIGASGSTISGGTVNVSNSGGEGISVSSNCTLTLSGGAVTVSNTGGTGGIYVYGTLTLDAFADTSDVVLTLNGNNQSLTKGSSGNIIGVNSSNYKAKIVTGASTTPPIASIFYPEATPTNIGGATANTTYH